ncbi:MAG: hypothetical protein IJJ28_02435 [Lentisphaeria bacterium]|nr:hypothetical protein [Lentisphaeria bacterium]
MLMIAYRANFRHDAELALAFEMVTAAAARVLGLADYGLRAGGPEAPEKSRVRSSPSPAGGGPAALVLSIDHAFNIQLGKPKCKARRRIGANPPENGGGGAPGICKSGNRMYFYFRYV